jgi:4-amino-4-deoxy-L-arabinose transferase-like glycosyltransferase
MKLTRILAYGFVLLISGFLLFYNLDDRLLWGDEAETALLAVNITKTGLPKVTDGRNNITIFGMGIDSNGDHIWTARPFLDQYLTALSFLTFGKNTFAARFPFALIGFLTIALLAAITYRIYNDHRIALMTALLLSSNIVFLLHARQCRYYAIIVFLEVILFYGYHRLINRQTVSGSVLISVALIGQFYCNYIIVASNIIALLLTSAYFIRKKHFVFYYLFVSILIVFIFSAPWLIYAKPFFQTSVISLRRFWENMRDYAYIVNAYFIALVILLIPIFRLFNARIAHKYDDFKLFAKESELLVWVLIPSIILPISCIPYVAMRYISPLLPLSALITASILTYHVPRKSIRYTLFTVLCFSNAIPALTAGNLNPGTLLRVPIVEFVKEITQGYQDRLSDIVSYLVQNGNPEQSVLVGDPEFPLIFYTGMRIIDFRLATQDRSQELPDWVLSTSASGIKEMPPIEIEDNTAQRYETINLRVHDSKRGDSIPDPRLRESFTTDRFTEMKIFRKK